MRSYISRAFLTTLHPDAFRLGSFSQNKAEWAAHNIRRIGGANSYQTKYPGAGLGGSKIV